MANFTAAAIKKAFIDLIDEQQLSKITIKDIVEKCGVNRNTFYYHYQDLPDLIEDIVKEEAESIIEKYPSVTSIVECFDALVEFASHRKRAIMHIYRSVNREAFENALIKISEHFICDYVNATLAEMSISEADKKAIISYYKCVCFGLVMEWLNSGMNDEFSREIRRIFMIKKDFAREVAGFLQG